MLFACAAAAQAPPPQRFAAIGGLKLESGEVIRDCRIGYRVFGTLDADRSNAVLVPTAFLSASADLAALAGPGKLLDTSRWYVIAVDALGNGVSSSPSNSRLQPRMRFPRFTIRDMVNSQHLVLTRHLGIPRLRAVVGISMGGMQAFEWIAAYPEFMQLAVPMLGTPRQTAYDLLLWDTQRKAIELDPAWNGGEYRAPPRRAMSAVTGIHLLAITTPRHRLQETPVENFPAWLAEVEKSNIERFDANNWLRQVQAMMAHDISKPYGGDMAGAAARVRARLLVVVGLQDQMVNPAPALEFARLTQADTIEINSPCGHGAVGCEMEMVRPRVARFLEGGRPE